MNKEILIQLYEQGNSAPSYTTLHEQYVLRVAIANHRSVKHDFDALVQDVVRIGRHLAEAPPLPLTSP